MKKLAGKNVKLHFAAPCFPFFSCPLENTFQLTKKTLPFSLCEEAVKAGKA